MNGGAEIVDSLDVGVAESQTVGEKTAELLDVYERGVRGEFVEVGKQSCGRTLTQEDLSALLENQNRVGFVWNLLFGSLEG